MIRIKIHSYNSYSISISSISTFAFRYCSSEAERNRELLNALVLLDYARRVTKHTNRESHEYIGIGDIMKFLIGKKLEMSQVFAEDGIVTPVTNIQVLPMSVMGMRTKERDGYSAVIVGAGKKRAFLKPQRNLAQGGGVPLVVKEFRLPADAPLYEQGSEIPLSQFDVGMKVSVTAVSKGKGFAGVVKRHHFRGHPASHGHKDQLRTSGSIGAGGDQHVKKGKRMAGRMGNEQVTVKGLKVMGVDAEKGILTVSGAVPGARNSIVIIKSQ